VITVFTDVDCGYCRKFHSEIEDYNAQGITVNYVAFPRSGLESESYNKIVSAWCSSDPKGTLTALKEGRDPALKLCQDHPVEDHYLLGQRIGITGTPAIISSSGDLLPGYLPPMELLKKLN
jgi:thiol:disulfide interchange protein DsbC